MSKIIKETPRLSLTLGGELKQGWDSTSRLLNRLESFAILKQRTEDFQDWAIENKIPETDKQTKKVFRNLDKCGQYLIFRNYLVSLRSRLIGSCSCKQHLLCAFCASRRGVKHSVAYKEKCQHVMKQSNSSLLFLTFTVKNGDDLMERFNHLKHSMQKLTRWRSDCIKGKVSSITQLSKIDGAVFAYEFKRGSGSNSWHPHIHMLSVVSNNEFINAEKLKAEWFAITGDSSVINIKYADDNAFLEVFAYALKFSEMEHSDRWFAFNELKGERLISSFGSLRGVVIPESDDDEPLDSDEPFVDVLYMWAKERGYQFHKEL